MAYMLYLTKHLYWLSHLCYEKKNQRCMTKLKNTVNCCHAKPIITARTIAKEHYCVGCGRYNQTRHFESHWRTPTGIILEICKENIPPDNDVKLCICVTMIKAISKSITKVHMLAQMGLDENKLVRRYRW